MRQRTGGWAAIVVGVLVLAGAGPVSAKSGFYVGGSLGQTTLKIDNLDLDLEQFDFSDSDTSYKVIAGYRFMGFFAVEASYLDFGSLADSVDTIEGTVGVRADLTGFDAVAMGMLPLGLADLFAKAGFVSWDADIRTAFGEIVELDTDSGTDMVYGIGAQLRFRGLAVRAEVEYFDIADADSVYLVSLGATFTF
jgi:OOP family OmpA-OmpF porin